MADFYNIHKDYLYDNEGTPTYAHEEFLGLEKNAAYAQYYGLLAAGYGEDNIWTNVFIVRSDGYMVEGDIIDNRTDDTPSSTDSGS